MTDFGRVVLANAFKTAHSDWQVVSDARQIDTVRKPGAVVLWTSKRTRTDLQKSGVLVDEITLWVLTAATKPEDIEDDLDALLLAALEVIEEKQAFMWAEAERGVLADTYDGYRITVTCSYVINPPETKEP